MCGRELARHGPGTFVPCRHRSAIEILMYRGTPGGLELQQPPSITAHEPLRVFITCSNVSVGPHALSAQTPQVGNVKKHS